jgi:hypothetical protein
MIGFFGLASTQGPSGSASNAPAASPAAASAETAAGPASSTWMAISGNAPNASLVPTEDTANAAHNQPNGRPSCCLAIQDLPSRLVGTTKIRPGERSRSQQLNTRRATTRSCDPWIGGPGAQPASSRGDHNFPTGFRGNMPTRYARPLVATLCNYREPSFRHRTLCQVAACRQFSRHMAPFPAPLTWAFSPSSTPVSWAKATHFTEFRTALTGHRTRLHPGDEHKLTVNAE